MRVKPLRPRKVSVCVRHVALVKEIRDAFKILVGKPRRTRLLWRLRCEREDNIILK